MTTGPATPDHPGQEATPLPGVVWGVDVGLARVGVASGDPDGVLATPVETVAVAPAPAALDRVVQLVRQEERSTGVVVGLPRHLDGHESTSAAEARRARSLSITQAGFLVLRGAPSGVSSTVTRAV